MSEMVDYRKVASRFVSVMMTYVMDSSGDRRTWDAINEMNLLQDIIPSLRRFEVWKVPGGEGYTVEQTTGADAQTIECETAAQAAAKLMTLVKKHFEGESESEQDEK